MAQQDPNRREATRTIAVRTLTLMLAPEILAACSGSKKNSSRLVAPAKRSLGLPGTFPKLRSVHLQPVFRASDNTFSEATYAAIAESGFNSVTMDLFMDAINPTEGGFNQRALDNVLKAVRNAAQNKLFVVVNLAQLYDNRKTGVLEGIPEWMKGPGRDSVQIMQTLALPYFREMTELLKNELNVLALKPIGEPQQYPVDENRLLRMYDAICKEILAINPRTRIMIEPTFGGSRPTGDPSLLTVDHKQLIWEPHFYDLGAPGDGWAADGTTNVPNSYASDAVSGLPEGVPISEVVRRIESHLVALIEFARRAQIPDMSLGEIGIARNAPGRSTWLQIMRELVAKYELSYEVWEWSADNGKGALSVVDPATGVASADWQKFNGLTHEIGKGEHSLADHFVIN